MIQCRNITLLQGDIEAVAAKSPMELTHLFEQISGSDAHKRSYDELQQAQVKAEEKASVPDCPGCPLVSRTSVIIYRI